MQTMMLTALSCGAVGATVGYYLGIRSKEAGEGINIEAAVVVPDEKIVIREEGRPNPSTTASFVSRAQVVLPTINTYIRTHSPSFVTCYDSRTKNPLWVYEKITRESIHGSAKRQGRNFKEDTSIPPQFRSKLDHFRHSGYDRGHLAPAADFKNSQKITDASFLLSNISPQVGIGFNRGYWERLEAFVRSLLTKNINGATCQSVQCVTGPLFLPFRSTGLLTGSTDNKTPSPLKRGVEGRTQSSGDEAQQLAKFTHMQVEHQSSPGGWQVTYPLIGGWEGPAVPTHFYKVLCVEAAPAPTVDHHNDNNKLPNLEQQQSQKYYAAFVLPNQALDESTPLTDFLVPISWLERAAGIRFFPGLLPPEAAAVLDAQRWPPGGGGAVEGEGRPQWRWLRVGGGGGGGNKPTSGGGRGVGGGAHGAAGDAGSGSGPAVNGSEKKQQRNDLSRGGRKGGSDVVVDAYHLCNQAAEERRNFTSKSLVGKEGGETAIKQAVVVDDTALAAYTLCSLPQKNITTAAS